MIVTPTALEGAYVFDVERRRDERGFFARTFSVEELVAHGLESRVEQSNISWNRQKGTLRGLHYQVAPHEETKIVRCTRGAIWDVMLDIRSGSPTFGRWHAEELTGDNHRMLYVPRGFAHGYLTLIDDTEVSYLVGHRYAPESGRGIRWDDPAFAIQWPLLPTLISAADLSHAPWK